MTVTFQRVGDWERMAKIAATWDRRFRRALETSVMQEAQMMRGLIVKGIASQAPGGRAFRPLSPFTVALRKITGGGGSKALMASGALRGSITVTRVGGSYPKAFIGVLRNAKGKNGKSLANIASMHEFGGTIRKTAKMNRFLWAMGRRVSLATEGVQVGGTTQQAFLRKGRWVQSNGRALKGEHIAAAQGAAMAAEVAERERRKANRGKAKGGVIRIPARPFIRPTLEAYGRPADVRARFYQRVAKAMGGDIGKISGAHLGMPRG